MRGEGVLAMLDAIVTGDIGKLLEDNSFAAAFVNGPKLFPERFATEKYFDVNVFKFVPRDGKESYVRYRVVPSAEVVVLWESHLTSKSSTYLFDELAEYLRGVQLSSSSLLNLQMKETLRTRPQSIGLKLGSWWNWNN